MSTVVSPDSVVN